MTEKYGFVYLWRDKKHNRYYVGSHWGTVDDGYICSSNWMRDSYKRRPEDFKRRILSVVDIRENLLIEEQRWLSMIKPSEIKIRYYNLILKTYEESWWNKEDSRKTITKKRLATADKNGSYKNAHKAFEKYYEENQHPMLGVRHTEESKTKMSKALKGKPGVVHTEEAKKKISEKNKLNTKKLWEDPEYKQKMILAAKNRKPISDETREKLKQRIPWNKGLRTNG